MSDKFKEFRAKMTTCAKELGVDLEMGTITYQDNSFSFSAKGYNGDAGKQEEFIRNCGKKGVPAHWYGRVFIGEGEKFKIIGIKPRGRKYVIAIQNVATGKTSVCTKNFPQNFVEEDVSISQEGGVLI